MSTRKVKALEGGKPIDAELDAEGGLLAPPGLQPVDCVTLRGYGPCVVFDAAHEGQKVLVPLSEYEPKELD